MVADTGVTDTGVTAQRALVETQRSLRAELTELGAFHGSGSLDYDANFADSSQVNAERGETGALVARLRGALSDVEHALGKLGGSVTPAYGLCEQCAKPVAPARLEAMPAARRCLSCESAR